MNRAIILIGPGLVGDKGDCLAFKISKVSGVDVELIDIKVVL